MNVNSVAHNRPDINCGDSYKTSLAQAVRAGLVDEATTVDTAVARALHGRFEVGEFDPPSSNPYTSIGIDAVGSEAHMRLARKAAQESVVLLKNEGQQLPLKVKAGLKVAVSGGR